MKEEELKEAYGKMGTSITSLEESNKTDFLLDCMNNPVNPDLQIKSLPQNFGEGMTDMLGYTKEEGIEIGTRFRKCFAFDNFGHAMICVSSIAADKRELIFGALMLYKHYTNPGAFLQALKQVEEKMKNQ